MADMNSLEQKPFSGTDPMSQRWNEELAQKQAEAQSAREAAEQARQAEIQRIREQQAQVVERQAESIQAGTNRMEQFKADVAASRSDWLNERRGAAGTSREVFFDIRTSTYRRGQAPSTAEGDVSAATQFLMEYGGVTSTAAQAYRQKAGEAARLRGEEPVKMTGEDVMSVVGQPMGQGVREALLRMEGGASAVRRFDEAQRSVAEFVTANIDAARGDDGLVDPTKLAGLAADHESFRPTMAPSIRQYITAVSTQANAITRKEQEIDAALRRARKEELSTGLPAPRALDSKKWAEANPEAASLLAGASEETPFPAEAAVWMTRTPEIDRAEEQNFVNTMGVDAFGAEYDPESADAVEVALVDDAARQAAVDQGMADAIERNGFDAQAVARDLIGEKPSDMGPAEWTAWTRQVYQQAKEQIDGRVAEMGQAVRDRQSQVAADTINAAYANVAVDMVAGVDEDLRKLTMSADYQNMSEADRKAAVRDLYVRKSQDMVDARLGGVSNIEEVRSIMQVDDEVAGTLRQGRVIDRPEFQSLNEQFERLWSQVSLDDTAIERKRQASASEVAGKLAMMGGSFVARDGKPPTHLPVPIGDRTYAMPSSYVTPESVGSLVIDPENWYVKRLLQSAPDGIISESLAGELMVVRSGPSQLIQEKYPDETAMVVGAAVARMPEDYSVRRVIEAPTVDALTLGANPPFNMSFYSSTLGPAMATVAALPDGEGEKENLSKALKGIKVPGIDKTARDIIDGDKTGLLQALYYDGGADGRQRAVAAAMMKGREALYQEAIISVVGGKSEVTGRTTQSSILQSLDNGKANVAQGNGNFYSHRDVMNAIQFDDGLSYPDQAEQIAELGEDLDITVLRRKVDAYDAALAKAGEAYGAEYGSLSAADTKTKRDHLAGWGASVMRNPDLWVQQYVDEAMEILDAFDALEDRYVAGLPLYTDEDRSKILESVASGLARGL